MDKIGKEKMAGKTDKDWLDIVKIVTGIITAIAVPIVIVWAGNSVQLAIAEKDVSTQLVRLAINVLSEVPAENKVPLRKWAARTIRKHSDVPLSDKAACLLIYNANFAGFVLGDGTDDDVNHHVFGPDTPQDPDKAMDPDAIWSGKPFFKK